jgi:hypothetical protein
MGRVCAPLEDSSRLPATDPEIIRSSLCSLCSCGTAPVARLCKETKKTQATSLLRIIPQSKDFKRSVTHYGRNSVSLLNIKISFEYPSTPHVSDHIADSISTNAP